MNTPNVDLPSYRGYRFPATVINHCVWLYFRFSLSYRDVEEMMAESGVVVSYETIREWCQKFGQAYAKRLRIRCGRLGDRWHLDEVFLRINGRLQYLWRAVDQDGEVLDILVQPRRSKQAAKKFFRRSDSGLLSIGAASGSASPTIETPASDEHPSVVPGQGCAKFTDFRADFLSTAAALPPSQYEDRLVMTPT
jgi:hypothetical protein